MLPTITIGGEQFYDMSSIVQPDRGQRPETAGISVNHTVGQTEFPDRNANGTNMDEEIAHIKAIDAYHVRTWGTGFGYNGIIFRSGRVYVVGKMRGIRTHIAHQNHRLGGFALAGDFSTQAPGVGQVLGSGRLLRGVFHEFGLKLVKGHGEWVLPEHRAQWATACPGEGGRRAIPDMLAVATELEKNAAELVKRRATEAIERALLPAIRAGNFDTLAHQIAWLTDRRLCA